MSDYLTIEQVKEQMRDYISSDEYFGDDKGRTEITKFWLDVLDRLDPDAKLRKVREAIESVWHYRDCCKHSIKQVALQIIDSHLTPSEPTEHEKFRQEAEELIARINNAVRELGE